MDYECHKSGYHRCGAILSFQSPIVIYPTDDVAYIWYYDHESAIQSAGINFVKDLPYFLVLLLAFQRFTLDDWGVNVALRDAASGTKPLHFPGVDVTVKLNQCFREHFGMAERATRVFGATSTSKDPKNVLSNKGLVAKIYYPETSRDNEVAVIEQARECGKDDEEIRGHLPEVIAWCDFPDSDTQYIRRALKIYKPELSKRGRVLRVIIVPQYYPITNLVGSTFWDIFWQCFRCRYRYFTVTRLN